MNMRMATILVEIMENNGYDVKLYSDYLPIDECTFVRHNAKLYTTAITGPDADLGKMLTAVLQASMRGELTEYTDILAQHNLNVLSAKDQFIF